MSDRGEIGPAIGVIFFAILGAAMLVSGLISISAGSEIILVGFGLMNLFVAYGLFKIFFGKRGSSVSKLPRMRQRLYGPSGDQKSVINQKLPPL